MAGLETCASCGRKLAPEAVKSAGGKTVCPPCYERAKAIVEEKRKRAAEEKKAAALKAKQEAARASRVVRDPAAEEEPAVVPTAAPGGVSEPVILPPSGLHRAASGRSGDAEVRGMVSSAGILCILARVTACLLLAGALLGLIANIVVCLGASEGGAGPGLLLVIGLGLVSLAVVGVPAALLWFLGGWIKKFSGLFARHLSAQ